ncbi:glucose-6-phosphate dehydrogenase [Polyangium aurulentum]|uniref:glucose-6-phosphate dehydrogenase n=1 Tax=Polyangium aurulentum TaxID=2567896 RepID=UPI0010AEE0BA|nr:glucose-6-phosphate dehydrogenase [Polyangium aurulentum]UQA56765.1 glucose-6-phosphate dehydrogenase [Polyangium aurulentum]
MQSVASRLETHHAVHWEAGARVEAAEACTLVLFGASGDLAQRKLLPALYRMALDGHLSAESVILGVALTSWSTEEFRAEARRAIARASADGSVDEEAFRSFARRLHYVPMDVTDASEYRRLRWALERAERAHGARGNRIFYLSLTPTLQAEAVRNLGDSGLSGRGAGRWTRLVVEKPFGVDLASARALNERIREHFDEASVYRMDHYLGKEMVQNLLLLRFANRILEPSWNRQHIDHVQLTCAETVGVEGRGAYYERAGVVRDMVQSHLLQLLALTAMDLPSSLSPDAVHDAKMAVMAAARPFTPERLRAECVRGQYGPGFMNGRPVPGYRQEPGVAPDSRTETFAMLTVRFDTPRWAGVPFYVRSGKRLPRRVTEVVVQFKDGPLAMATPNQLVMRVQPDEGISLRFATKAPGRVLRMHEVALDLRYDDLFDERLGEAYEHLLLDCMLGISTRYVRQDLAERGWELFMPVLEAWAAPNEGIALLDYAAGTWGPPAAGRVLEARGHRWNDGPEKRR